MSSNSLSTYLIDRYTLSNQAVNDMVEDEDGYIWIGTRR
ncbi:MAG: two-component regulator propeller domain-containing protein, partial [Candidatus Cryptobacteroides sp.]